MNKVYQKIEFEIGSNIEDAVNRLLFYKKLGKLISGEFNGHILYSDTVTMDDAYVVITGQTKAERDKSHKEWLENRKKEEEEEHQEKIPYLACLWMQKGREILMQDKWKHWDKIVPIRLSDLYHGMELGNCLDIVKILNNGGTFDEAKVEIESQDHSGMSYGLVCVMVREFCDRGQEFVEYLK